MKRKLFETFVRCRGVLLLCLARVRLNRGGLQRGHPLPHTGTASAAAGLMTPHPTPTQQHTNSGWMCRALDEGGPKGGGWNRRKGAAAAQKR